MTGTTDEDEETRELFRLRDLVATLTAERDRLKASNAVYAASLPFWPLHMREMIDAGDVEGMKAEATRRENWVREAHVERHELRAETQRLKASNEGIAASLEAQVEAARKDERAACLDLAVDAMSPFTGTDNDAHNEACRRIIDAIKRRGAR